MRIATHTALVITPIFALLGAAIALLFYTTESRELSNSLEEELSSLGFVASQFVGEGADGAHVEVVKARSVLGEGVNTGRGKVLVAVDAEVAPALVVREENDHIGFAGGLRCGREGDDGGDDRKVLDRTHGNRCRR